MIELFYELTPFYVWRYNGAMEIVNFPEHQNNQLGATGICPHCGTQSYFHPGATCIEGSRRMGYQRGISAAKCQSCKEYVLIVGEREAGPQPHSFSLVQVYPLGKPKDDFDPAVPPAIGADFGEALRCEWIKAYKGCVVMCRRAVQASALKFEAPKNRKLTQQIDWLFEKGKITESLRDFAHEVRLTGNVGAHPGKDSEQQPDEAGSDEPGTDNLEDVTEKDAADIIEFTREYLHHVYVMPAKLRARKTATPPPAVVGVGKVTTA
jgi:hypothetical protein